MSDEANPAEVPDPDSTASRPSGVRVWIMASRPKTLPAAAAPVVVGSAVAAFEGVFDALTAVLAFAGALMIQIGTNLSNDYYDHRRGADAHGRLGPTRVTQSGLVPPRQVFLAFLLVDLIALAAGVWLMVVGGWPIVVVGVASLIAGWAYTGGPYPLGYHGLGDVFAFIFFGPLAVVGTWFVQAQATAMERLGWQAWQGEFVPISDVALMASVPIGLLTSAVLVVNNIRDIDTDRRVGKGTLAVRFGRRGTRVFYSALLLVSFAFAPLTWLMTDASAWVLLALVALVPAFVPWKAVLTQTDGPALNRALALTALSLLVYAIGLSAGLLVG